MGSNTTNRQDVGKWEQEGIYKDTGCALHDKCLTCPLPECVYGDTLRFNRAVVYPIISSTMSREELATKANVSIRTAQRFLVRYNKAGGDFGKFIGVKGVSS